MRFIYTLVALSLVFGFFYVANEYDKAANYSETEGLITTVQQKCALEGYNKSTDILPCDKAEQLHQFHPEYRKWTLHRDIRVMVGYRSPADGETHTSELVMEWHDGDKVPKSGDKIKVLASLTEAEKLRQQ